MGKKQYLEADLSDNYLDYLYSRKEKLLKAVLSGFCVFKPIIGLELEFYLIKEGQKLAKDDEMIAEFITKLAGELDVEAIAILEVIREEGAGQIEIATKPYDDIEKLCSDYLTIKKTAIDLAERLGMEVSFASQPFLDDRGSALHINLSLMDELGNNVFDKNQGQESDLLLFAISGVLELINHSIIFAMPSESDYVRFTKSKNVIIFPPLNVSWGYNNRTTALRIPMGDKFGKGRRLELRTPVSEADIYLNIAVFLIMVFDGIAKKKKPIEPTYGNAFDEQYSYLKTLAPNYDDARAKLLEDNVLLKKIKGYLLD
ncbi:MAG: hypothetical protein O3B09_00615 [Proteobacteria bacterium]|nr:hypothetical protein [Pseudomonadota bacterium]